MISVLVLGFSTFKGRLPAVSDTVRTLTALVPATVEGVVRDVTLLTTGHNADLEKIADHAGCALVEAPGFAEAIKTGARLARCDVVLVLPAGVTFDRSLTDEIAAVIPEADGSSARCVQLRSIETGTLGRLVPRAIPTVGLLAPRHRLITTASENFAALVRAARPARFFKTRAWAGD